MTTRRLRLLLWPAGIAVGLAAEHFSIAGHAGDNHWLDLAVGWAYIGAGLIAWERLPHNRVGPLMVAVGFAWFVSNFGNAEVPLLASLGEALALSQPILAHLMLAYPSGHLERPIERVVVGAIYAWVVAFGVALALTHDAKSVNPGCGCKAGALAIVPSHDAYDTISNLGAALGGLSAVAVLGLLAARFIRASPAARRTLAPLWLGSALAAVAFVSEAAAGGSGTGAPASAVTRIAELLIPLAFLLGLFRTRLAQASIADLVVALGGPLPGGGLRELLAGTLKDPSLRLAFPLPNGAGYVDDEGNRIELPAPSSGRAVTLLEGDQRPVAALIHDQALVERRSFVEAVGAAANLALENERLHAELRAQLREVRASRARIVDAADAERKRLERDLHDGAQQRLVTLSLALALAREEAERGADGSVAETLAEASDEVRLALSELRELARGLHPTILAEAGLGPALQSLAERSSVPTTITSPSHDRFPQATEATAYFVVCEALANIAKHAHASSATISARRKGAELVVEVIDDGVGGANFFDGSGLAGLRDRVAARGGSLVVGEARGGGTHLTARIPCE